jgi:hypothetical protein
MDKKLVEGVVGLERDATEGSSLETPFCLYIMSVSIHIYVYISFRSRYEVFYKRLFIYHMGLWRLAPHLAPWLRTTRRLTPEEESSYL